MLIQTNTLTPRQLDEVTDLLRECETYDNASACVQMDHALNADPGTDSWFLSYQGGELAGLASVFAPSLEEAEISLCVKPALRKAGQGMQLLTHTADYLHSRGVTVLLLVSDRKSETGCRMAARASRQIQHTEYSMQLARPFSASIGNRMFLREASPADLPDFVKICTSAYGADDRDFDAFLRNSLSTRHRKGHIAFWNGQPVACCFVGYHGDSVSINTVAVLREMQGKGLGQEFLSAIIRQLESENPVIQLEVDSTNAPAYRLYRKLGFIDLRAIDYHILLRP